MAITLTEKAANRVRKFMAAQAGANALRVALKPTGCSGNAYVMDYAEAPGPDDQVFESQGVKILVHKNDLLFLDGTEIDFTRENLNESFRFNNPNEKARCGCGESFTV